MARRRWSLLELAVPKQSSRRSLADLTQSPCPLLSPASASAGWSLAVTTNPQKAANVRRLMTAFPTVSVGSCRTTAKAANSQLGASLTLKAKPRSSTLFTAQSTQPRTTLPKSRTAKTSSTKTKQKKTVCKTPHPYHTYTHTHTHTSH